ncbi:hypothetical protein EDB83DRAFT_2315384 [Lactarius deliciosus]|nr:hypothetical protein EDB83DRAFT_2315384 [Lactarius deliciosus]
MYEKKYTFTHTGISGVNTHLSRYNATDCIPARLVHHENAEEYAGAKGTDTGDRDRVVGIVVRRNERLALRIVPAHVLLDKPAAAPSWVEGPDDTVAHVPQRRMGETDHGLGQRARWRALPPRRWP